MLKTIGRETTPFGLTKNQFFLVIIACISMLSSSLFLAFQYLPNNPEVSQSVEQSISTSATIPLKTLSSSQAVAANPSAEELVPADEDDRKNMLDQMIAKYSDDRISLAVMGLGSDSEFAFYHNENEQVRSASLYKTLAEYRLLQLIDEGRQSKPDKLLSNCMEIAITISDNECGMLLQKLALPYELDPLLSDWGMDKTTLSGVFPKTSARDQATLYKDIFAGNRLSKESHKTILSNLASQQLLSRLPEYDNDVQIYHKTGDLGALSHTATIVGHPDHPYTVILLTDGFGDDLPSRYSAMADIHEEVHQIMTGL